MKYKILQTFILFLVILGGFFAFYMRKPVEGKSRDLPATLRSSEKSVSSLSNQTATFVIPIDIKKISHFGILGEGRGEDFSKDPVNTVVLNQLFEAMKVRDVQAIFFSGNLISGIKKEGVEGLKPIDTKTLEENLGQFSQLYDSIFEAKMPFYPALGDRELKISKGAETYLDHFHLDGADIVNGELLYTVSAGLAFFAVIATDELNVESQKVERMFSSSTLAWLKKVLTEAGKTHQYLFVVGYEPAYPSTTTFSKTEMPQRDSFWKVLVDHKVVAYFSSREHLFDRSNRSGVWQIISGGGGAPLSQGGGSQPFFHFLLLTIPATGKEGSTFPSIQVIDNKGKVIEEFVLSLENQALYQMRIS